MQKDKGQTVLALLQLVRLLQTGAKPHIPGPSDGCDVHTSTGSPSSRQTRQVVGLFLDGPCKPHQPAPTPNSRR